MNVLVTGCAGFLGSELCKKLLEAGHMVYGIDDLSCGFKENLHDFWDDVDHFVWLEKDIRNDDCYRFIDHALRGRKLDVIYHFAARGEVYWCQDNPTNAVDVNVNGTLKVLEYAAQKKVKHFIFTDTSAEYDNIDLFPTEELNAPNAETPRGIYSITKMTAAQFVRAFSEEHGFGATIFRPFNVYGPTMNLERDIPPVIGSFTKRMLEGHSPIIYGDGSKRRDFIYVDDITELFMRVLSYREQGTVRASDYYRLFKNNSRTFNAGTGENYSIYEIYELVSREIFGGKDNWLVPMFKQDQSGEAEITLAYMRNTTSFFEWKPTTSIEDGIKLTVRSIHEKMQA